MPFGGRLIVSTADLVDPEILKRFVRKVQNENHGTTYLLTGNEPEKKRALAVAFAKALNCCEKKTQVSCHCDTCQRIESGVYPDVKWIGEDAEIKSLKLADVRSFLSTLALRPFEGRTKVFVFQGAERLTPESQNALLKSLEEPPPGNVIFLLVRDAVSLFPTIVSRAIEIKVPPFDVAHVRGVLIQDGATQEEAEVLARHSQGALGRARQEFQDRWFEKKNKWFDSFFQNAAQCVEELHNAKRIDVEPFFGLLGEWARDLVVFKVMREGTYVVHVDRVGALEKQTEQRALDQILELFDSVKEIEKVFRAYGNQKLALTQMQILFERFLNL